MNPLENNQHREVVRLRTTFWTTARGGIAIKKELIPLRRKSEGVQLLDEDCRMAGAEMVAGNITNLSECKDGVYTFEVCNESKDWETGIVDDYDYKLVPFIIPK